MLPMKLLILLACSGYREPDGKPDSAADTDDTGSTGSGTEAPTLEELLGDCGGQRREPEAWPNQLTEGADLHRLTLDSPAALCNDGTQAVVYVRPGTGDSRDRWSLHLQGGGSCTGHEECEARWCGTDDYDASKMSSRWAPEAVGGSGITSVDPANPFAEWTHVYFYYCSSDDWTGQSEATIRSAADGSGAGRDMRIERRGHEILAAGLEALRRSPVSDDSDVVMPDFDDSEAVLFSGTAAGSVGAQHNADWIAGQVGQGAIYRAVFDAAISPRAEATDPAVQAGVDIWWQADAAARLAAEPVAPFMDESCVQAWGASADAWRCQTSRYVLYDHITAPFMVRMDLSDPKTGADYALLGSTAEEFSLSVQTSLQSLADLRQTAIDGADMAVTPGAYGPDCGQHIGLESSAWTFSSTLGGSTLADAMGLWLSGEALSLIDTLPPTLSVCEAVEER